MQPHRVKVTFWLDTTVHKALKLRAIGLGKALGEMVEALYYADEAARLPTVPNAPIIPRSRAPIGALPVPLLKP